MRCIICRDDVPLPADTDWEGGMCDVCWRRTNRITRGWFALVQQLAEEAGWPDRLLLEHNILWDILVNQARQARRPPTKRKERDMRKAHVTFKGVKSRQLKFRR